MGLLSVKIGLITDMHLGFVRGSRDDAHGVNQREQDVLDAARLAVDNLVMEGVDAIVDLGDIAHVPAPKKRALMTLVDIIRNSKVPWYSANGNHTLQRTKSDLHLYDVLSQLCQNFHGYTMPSLIRDIGFYLIPYGTEVEALRDIPTDTRYIGGHFACDDVPFPGEHVSVSDLPKEIPTFLGHYHTRKGRVNAYSDIHRDFLGVRPEAVVTLPDIKKIEYDGPLYIGATERFAWGEANNPTGVYILDSDSKIGYFKDHPTREWVDVIVAAEGVLDALRVRDIEGKIVRVSVEATVPEYHGLDIKAIREFARSALEFQIRRSGTAEALALHDHADTQTYALMDRWRDHTEGIKGAVMRNAVLQLGNTALASAGVVDA